MSRLCGSGRGKLARTLLLSVLSALLIACSSGEAGGSEALVVPDRLRVRSSTAEAARTVGELQGGQSVVIKQRAEVDGVLWALIDNGDGIRGWTQARNLIDRNLAEESGKLSEQTKEIQTQAIGRSKATLKLRLTPDRTTEENVLTLLPSGTEMEIVARDRRPRPAVAGSEGETPTDTVYDEWYQVRLQNNKVTPAGWIYGGSIELMVPPEISYYVSFGRKIIGWQRLDKTADEGSESGSLYLVLERSYSTSDSGVDFDRIKVLGYDEDVRDYYTPYREDLKGRLPVTLNAGTDRGTFQIPGVTGDGTSPIEYSYERAADGRVKVTRLTPKEAPARKRRR